MFNFLPLQKLRLVLVAGDGGALLVASFKRRVESVLFAPRGDAGARDNIRTFLAQHPALPVTILVNNAGQELLRESLPPLNILDRKKLVKRWRAQRFPKAYATADRMVTAREAFLVALYDNSALAFWMEALPSERVALGLLPVECAHLMFRLLPEVQKGWGMLLAEFETGGVRQIVIRDGQVVFTRLTEALPVDISSAERAVMIMQLVEDSRSYLTRYGLTETTAFPVVILLRPGCELSLDAPNLMVLTPSQAAERCGFLPDGFNGDGAVDCLFALDAAYRSLSMPLLPLALRQKRQISLIAKTGLRAALATLTLAIGLTGWSMAQLVIQLVHNRQESLIIAQMQKQIEEQEAALAPSGQSLGKLRAALERQRLFSEPVSGPADVVGPLAKVLEGRARATAYDWRCEGGMKVNLRLDPSAAPVSDREAVVLSYQNLAEQLAQAMPNYNVTISRYPFSAAPGEALTNTSTDIAVPDALTAEVTIRRRP